MIAYRFRSDKLHRLLALNRVIEDFFNYQGPDFDTIAIPYYTLLKYVNTFLDGFTSLYTWFEDRYIIVIEHKTDSVLFKRR